MIEESLQTYRQERKAFILGLKHYYGIDFYSMEVKERNHWLESYIYMKREFFEHMIEHWKYFPPEFMELFPRGYILKNPKKYK